MDRAPLFLLAVPLAAQSVQATLTDRVLDSSGAGVPNVPVQVENVDTNQLTSTVTNSAGQYTTPHLQPGRYSITVEAPGFKKLVRDSLFLNIAQTLTVDLALEVGGGNERVTVTGEAPLIETSKADRGGIIDRERVHELS